MEYVLPDSLQIPVRFGHRDLPLIRTEIASEAPKTGCCVPSTKLLNVKAKVLNMTPILAVLLPEGCYILDVSRFIWIFNSAEDSIQQHLFSRTSLLGEPELIYVSIYPMNTANVKIFSYKAELIFSHSLTLDDPRTILCDTSDPTKIVINRTTLTLKAEEISRSPTSKPYPEDLLERLLFTLREKNASAAFSVFDFETVALAQEISRFDLGLREEISRFVNHIASTILDLPTLSPGAIKLKLDCHPDLEIGSRLPTRKDRLIESMMSRAYCLGSCEDLWPFHIISQKHPRWALRLLLLSFWSLKQVQLFVLSSGAFESEDACVFLGRKNIPLIKSLRDKLTLTEDSTNFQVHEDPEFRNFQVAVKDIQHGPQCGFRSYLRKILDSLPDKKFPGPPIFIGKKLLTPNRLRTAIARINST